MIQIYLAPGGQVSKLLTFPPGLENECLSPNRFLFLARDTHFSRTRAQRKRPIAVSGPGSRGKRVLGGEILAGGSGPKKEKLLGEIARMEGRDPLLW